MLPLISNAAEIAGLFHTGMPAVNAAVKAIRKPDALKAYKVCSYMQLENGLYADVYSLDIPIAFHLNTYSTHVASRQSSLEGKTADMRDVYTERKSRVLPNTYE